MKLAQTPFWDVPLIRIVLGGPWFIALMTFNSAAFDSSVHFM